MTAITLGADHAGSPLKEELKSWLIGRGYEVVDCGTQYYRLTTTAALLQERELRPERESG